MGENRHTLWAWKAMLVAAAVVVSLGCGDGRPKLVPVSGRVLIDGQPIEHGFVRVHPIDYRPASGALESGGRFRLSTYEQGDCCILFTHPVTVNALEVINTNSQRWHAPKNYRNTNTSGLTIEVDQPTDDAEIELTWAGENRSSKPVVAAVSR